MRVMVFVKSTEEAEMGFRPSPEMTAMLAEMNRYNDALRQAGILIECDGLAASSEGKRVLFDGADRTVVDGPFPHPRELVAGYWLWNVKDLEEAVAWVKRCPNPMRGPSEIEIRPIDLATG
jgi:hypothetical protein